MQKVVVVLILLSVIFNLMIVPASAWDWENDNHLLADGGGQNYHGHSTILLANGSIFCAHYDYPDHSDGGSITSHVSHDKGTTWVVGSTIWDGTVESSGAVNSGLGLSPNGTVVILIQRRDYGGSTYYGMQFKRSFDNGVTWTSAQYVNTSEYNATRHISSQVVTKGNIMYVPVYTDVPSRIFTIYVSTDNGASWSKRSTVLSSSSYSYCTLAPMSNDTNNGSFIWYTHLDPTRNYYRISTDNCSTWGSLTAMDTTNIRDPDIYVMFNESGQANYFLHGRDLAHSSSFSFWYSTNGITWTDNTYVDSGGVHEAYSSGCAVGNDLILTYSHDGDYCNLRYTWIYNVTDLEEDEGLNFMLINNLENNSIVQETNRTFEWTNMSVTTYSIRVSNDSSFTDIFLQLDNISEGCELENMPGGDFYSNETHVVFILPYLYNITYYGYHYYQVRSYG